MGTTKERMLIALFVAIVLASTPLTVLARVGSLPHMDDTRMHDAATRFSESAAQWIRIYKHTLLAPLPTLDAVLEATSRTPLENATSRHADATAQWLAVHPFTPVVLPHIPTSLSLIQPAGTHRTGSIALWLLLQILLR